MVCFYLDAIRKKDKSGLDMRLQELHNSQGYPISWIELVNFSEDIVLLSDGIFIGDKFKSIQFIEPSKILYEAYEYCIELIDGSIWIIFTSDINFYSRLMSKYICKDIESDFDEYHP